MAGRLSTHISSWRAASRANQTSDTRISASLIAFVLVWIAAVSAGVVWLWQYKTTPGLASGPPRSWPASTGLRRSGPTLVVAFHPRCSCSQASVTELARLMASVPHRPAVYALFVGHKPEAAAAPAVSSGTSLWERAVAIPGVIPIADPDGELASAFRVETSGDVIAYSASGELLFHGGLTAARGHEGDSFGRQRLLAVLRGDTPDARSSPVFGCPLHERPVRQYEPSRSDLE